MRVVIALITLLLCVFAYPMHCAAAETETDLQTIYEGIAPSELILPEEAADELDDLGLRADEPESFLTLTPSAVMQSLLRIFRDELSAPLVLCCELIALTVLSGILSGLCDTVSDGSMKHLAETLCVILCAAGAAKPLGTCISRTVQALDSGQVFMASFVPVFSSFLAAGGSVGSSAAYQVFVLFLTEGMMALTNSALLPLLESAAALGIIDAVNPTLKLGGFSAMLRKAVTWLLGSAMTLFSALLSIRSFVASAADSLASKTVRLLSSSLIPIVGGAVSDAYGTVQGSMILLRNGVGAVGIFVILSLVLPPLISLLIYRAVFTFASAFAGTVGNDAICKLFQHMQDILAAAFAMIVCFSVMLIFSSAILLLLVGGGN